MVIENEKDRKVEVINGNYSVHIWRERIVQVHTSVRQLVDLSVWNNKYCKAESRLEWSKETKAGE